MTHYVGSWMGCAPSRGRTACGVKVFKTNVEGEANTEVNDRIDFAEVWPKVNCRQCLRSVEYRRRPLRAKSTDQ